MATDTPASALAAGPRHLSPRDEARVTLARAAWALAGEAHALIPVDPDAPAGDLLRQALAFQNKAQRLVEHAVVAERERGTTWEQIAGAAGNTKQAAHERWSGNVDVWARLGRVTNEDEPTAGIVAFLDKQYAKVDPDRPDAVSAGLDATRHPGSAAYEVAQRTRGQQLHARLDELERDKRRNHQDFERLRGSSDREGWLRLAANRTASADINDILVQVYEELITAEPALADEHRANAEQHRNYIDSARGYADLALRKAGEL
ncbi:hypothetical protein [Streptomyces sp. NPDC093097]|uniref:hypothetical protein n=1 Tax=Streptomyces sp. NPDC093097 TaxID=3366027 RepID=UPI0037F9251A